MLTVAFRLIFGVLAVLIGGAILVWCFYNYFFERQPEFTGDGSLGIGPAMVLCGLGWLRNPRGELPRPSA